jgi:type III pantothenate kinase
VDGLFAHSRIDRVKIRGVILGSVVPPLTGTMATMTERYFGVPALIVEPGRNVGMPILYENPAEVGADRIVNAVAAFEKFGKAANRPLIVVDFGTATTFDAISAKGEYLGGAICPGVQISADALFQRAARLPRIDVRKPAKIVGRTTVGAMESGLFYGYVGMVEGLVRRMGDELGGHALCIATGGLAEVIAPETPLIEHVDPDLTLHGLRMVWERNQK